MTDTVIIALINSAGLILVAIIGLITNVKLKKVHTQINGRMDDLIEVTKSASKAEGKLEEQGENQIRMDAGKKKNLDRKIISIF